MNARLEIKKMPREKNRRGPPVEPEMVARKTHQHRPHTEIQPARGLHAPHAGIDHRIASEPVLPGLEPAGSLGGFREILAKPVTSPRHVFKFDARLVLELLHKVAMPAKAGGKTAERSVPSPIHAGSTQHGFLESGDALLQQTDRCGHRKTSPCEIRADARASGPPFERTRHRHAVISAAMIQKRIQSGLGDSFTAALRPRFFRNRILAFKRQWVVGQRGPVQKLWRFDKWTVHRLLPALGPAVAIFQTPNHSVLTKLMPTNSSPLAPGLHREIATISPVRAGFLV